MNLPFPAIIHVAAPWLFSSVVAFQLFACSKDDEKAPSNEEPAELRVIPERESLSADGSQIEVAESPTEVATDVESNDPPEPPSRGSTLPTEGIFEEEAFLALLGLAPVPPYYIGGLITPEDISQTLGLAGEITAHEVPGLHPTPFHNGIRLTRSEDKAGVIFEVRYTPNLIEQVHTFEYLKRTNQHEAKRLEVGSEGFWSSDGTFTRVVSRDEVTKTIISVTCDEIACHVPALLTFVRNAQNRLNG